MSKLYIRLLLIPTIIVFCFQSVFAGYNVSFTRESLKKNRLIKDNGLSSSQSLSKVYCQVLFETDKENGLNAITKPANKKYKRKNPTLAFGLAFVPGFFIHGLGHFYIGEYTNATLLFLCEVTAMGIVIDTALRQLENRPKFPESDIAWRSIVVNALFFGSWIYDYIGAPIKAKKMNEENESTFYIYPDVKADKVSLNIACFFDKL